MLTNRVFSRLSVSLLLLSLANTAMAADACKNQVAMPDIHYYPKPAAVALQSNFQEYAKHFPVFNVDGYVAPQLFPPSQGEPPIVKVEYPWKTYDKFGNIIAADADINPPQVTVDGSPCSSSAINLQLYSGVRAKSPTELMYANKDQTSDQFNPSEAKVRQLFTFADASSQGVSSPLPTDFSAYFAGCEAGCTYSLAARTGEMRLNGKSTPLVKLTFGQEPTPSAIKNLTQLNTLSEPGVYQFSVQAQKKGSTSCDVSESAGPTCAYQTFYYFIDKPLSYSLVPKGVGVWVYATSDDTGTKVGEVLATEFGPLLHDKFGSQAFTRMQTLV